MNKRGAGQVEIIIAFVLFVGFVMFSLYFFSPLRSDRLYDSSLDYAFREIIKNSSIQVDQRTVTVSDDISAEIVSIKFSDLDVDNVNFIVVKENGEEVDHWSSGGNIVFDRNGGRFFFIQFSDDFPENVDGEIGFSLAGNGFSLGTSSTKEIVSEKKFLLLNASYYSDYEGLKKQFNLPARIDFSFGLYLDNRIVESKRKIPDNLKVTANRERKEIIDAEGNIVFGEIGVSVW